MPDDREFDTLIDQALFTYVDAEPDPSLRARMRLLRNSLIRQRSSLAQLPCWGQTGSQVMRSASNIYYLYGSSR
jgi:hypothetical protein